MTDPLQNLATDLGSALEDDEKQRRMRVVPPPPSAVQPPLADQIGKIETIGRTLKERIRRELLTLRYDYLTQTDKVRNESERRLADELRQLTEDFNDKTRELELLAKRMGI
jgi:hypothetical protein